MPSKFKTFALALLFPQLAFSGQVIAQDTTAPKALKTAIELCQSSPSDPDAVHSILTSIGWQKGNDETLIKSLISLFINQSFDATRIEYTYSNSSFMAASVLGNSSLGPQQFSYRLGDLTLSVLGVTEGTPYCVLTGPDELALMSLEAGLDSQITARTEYVTIGLHSSMGATVFLGQTKLKAISALLRKSPQLDEETRAELTKLFNLVLMPANIQITPQWESNK